MVTHGNCLYVFGGMDDERQEQMHLWRWNLNAEEGFEAITYRYTFFSLLFHPSCTSLPACCQAPWKIPGCLQPTVILTFELQRG